MKTRIPPIEDLSKHSEESVRAMLKDQSDTVCVLLAASFLEQTLASLLERFFIEGTTSNGLLNPPRGALRSFRDRASVSYCLGLIPKSLYQNLCKVGEIRNEFAHSYLSLSFNDPQIAGMVRELTRPAFKEVVTSQHDQGLSPPEDTNPRSEFETVVVLMSMRLLLTSLDAKRRRRKAKGWA